MIQVAFGALIWLVKEPRDESIDIISFLDHLRRRNGQRGTVAKLASALVV